MHRTSLTRQTPIRRVSLRRLEQLTAYIARRTRFLRQHPYCQLWLAEHDIPEEYAIVLCGRVPLPGALVLCAVPRSHTIHHRDKRRGERLLDERFWMAVSRGAHRRIEENKSWARASGYLQQF